MRVMTVFSLVCILCVCTSAQDTVTSVHVIVALCDNDSQGIVPVPATLGNGDDPHNNLYWGALYGTKSFLKRSDAWTLLETKKAVSNTILERAVFRHRTKGIYLVADAYRGREIKAAVVFFLNAVVGNGANTLAYKSTQIPIGGGAHMVVYVGHNGLMDFQVDPIERQKETSALDAMVLACKSQPYFHPFLQRVSSRSVLLTTGFMAPEAYTLEAALAGWIVGENATQIKGRAASAYHKYQKCGLNGARRLFYTE